MLSASIMRMLDPKASGPTDRSLACNETFAQLLAQSYFDVVGMPLLPAVLKPEAKSLYEAAPFCLLVHNTAADPRFIYGNRAAQQCFDYTWEEITQLPSRLSAPAMDRAERQEFIAHVRRDGFATGYRGLRVAKSGRLFWIEDVTMWQIKHDETLVAEAAIYPKWRDA